MLALARQSDALVENFKVGGLAEYGLDYPRVAAINPRLVYASITGFGQDGPYADRAGYDFIIQGMSGFMSVTGERDDLPGGGPQKAGVAITDLMTGMYTSVALLAALAHRERSGQGQWIDACLFDSSVAMMAVMNMNYLVSGDSAAARRQRAPEHRALPGVRMRRRTRHRRRRQRRAVPQFLRSRGQARMGDGCRFATNAARVRHRDTIVPMIDAVMRTRTQQQWLAALEQAGIPCGPINRIDQVFGDPHTQARGMKLDLPHPLAGSVPQVRAPLRLSGSPLSYAAAPPLLGEHTAHVLHDRLGIGDARLTDWRRAASSAVATGHALVRRRTIASRRRGQDVRSVTRRPAFWITYAIASLAALVIAVRLFPLAIPIVNLDITMSRERRSPRRARRRRGCNSRRAARALPRGSRMTQRRRTTSSSKAAARPRSRRSRKATGIRRTGGKCGCSRSA